MMNMFTGKEHSQEAEISVEFANSICLHAKVPQGFSVRQKGLLISIVFLVLFLLLSNFSSVSNSQLFILASSMNISHFTSSSCAW